MKTISLINKKNQSLKIKLHENYTVTIRKLTIRDEFVIELNDNFCVEYINAKTGLITNPTQGEI